MYAISRGSGIDIDFLDKQQVLARLKKGHDIALLAGGFFETNCFSGNVEAM